MQWSQSLTRIQYIYNSTSGILYAINKNNTNSYPVLSSESFSIFFGLSVFAEVVDSKTLNKSSPKSVAIFFLLTVGHFAQRFTSLDNSKKVNFACVHYELTGISPVC